MKDEDVNFPRPDVTVGHYITLTVPFPFPKPFFTTHSPYPGMPSEREIVDVHHFFLPSCVTAAGLHLSKGVVRVGSSL